MLLSEAGYDQLSHDARLRAIRKSTITEAINELVILYADLYDVDAYHINCGMCEDFAHDVVSLFPEAIAEWGDGFTTKNDDEYQYSYHCIVLYKDKFYDSQHPEGVDDFREISAFQS